MSRRPTKLKKSYSSLLRHATKRARGLPDIDEDGDTDSVASDASSVNHPYHHPLQRRRSVRLQEQKAALGSQDTVVMAPASLQSQNTVAMSSLQPQNTVVMRDTMKRMSTTTRWNVHRKTETSRLKQQATMAIPEEEAEDDDDALPSPSPKRRHVAPPSTSLMKKQSTTAALRGMMVSTRLEEVPNQNALNGESRVQNPERVPGNRRTKRKSSVIQSPSTDIPPKRVARPGILKYRKKVSIATEPDPVLVGWKHGLSDEDSEGDHPRKRRRPLVRRQSTMVAQQGSVFIPPQEEWPLNLAAQVVWTVPLVREDGSRKHALAVHVAPSQCLLGDEDGTVVSLNEQVTPVCEYHLPAGVKCLLPDAEHVYAGCNDGALYDISHEDPRLIWKAKGFGQLYQLDTYQGEVAVSDEHGNVGLVNYDGAFLWKQRSSGAFGWMVCIDDTGVYHGHAGGVTKYSRLDGQQMWHCATPFNVMAGCKVEDFLYAAVGSSVMRIDKFTGEIVQQYNKGKAATGSLHCCAVGGGLVYAGGNKLVCYDGASGEVVYNLKLPQRAESLHYFQARLFCLGAGALHVLDLTQPSIALAKLGKSVQTVEVSPDPAAPKYTPLKAVSTLSQQQSEEQVAGGAVLLECYRDKPRARQGKLKVRALSRGYSGKLAIQFPAELCKPGVKYVVDKLQLSEGSSFYRVSGKIQEVENSKDD